MENVTIVHPTSKKELEDLRKANEGKCVVGGVGGKKVLWVFGKVNKVKDESQ